MPAARSWVRDALVTIALLSLVVGTASAYTQNWPPAVIVESGSMMHRDEDVGYGRFGTIDPGDLVLVKDLDEPWDVETLVENGPERYGLPGDVLVFRRDESGSTPIIHRALAYVEVVGEEEARSYRVRWDPDAACVGGARKDPSDPRWCVYGRLGVDLRGVPHAGTQVLRPDSSGFLTKGDNPDTNGETDQATGLAPEPVPLERVEGKARGELPWLGLAKLAVQGKPNQDNPPAGWVRIGSAYAPGDLWVMLGLSLALLVGGPMAWDAVKERRARRAGR